jgi:hypothetical protein
MVSREFIELVTHSSQIDSEASPQKMKEEDSFMKYVKRKKNTLVISLEMEKPWESASGKSFLVASTHGVKQTEVIVRGRPVHLVASAFIYKPKKDSDE